MKSLLFVASLDRHPKTLFHAAPGMTAKHHQGEQPERYLVEHGGDLSGKFYRLFNRFVMKCFLHEALMFWGYAAWKCIIDNTNLARLRGAGSRAVIVPEMEAFSHRYGVQFVCHAIDHPNRTAGNERSFWSVETSFLPGRTFTSLEDLNGQARPWATERMEQRPLIKARVIPAQLFEHERLYLHPLPEHLPAPWHS